VHIALLSPVWPPAGASNGIVTYVAVLREHLLKRGHDVSILADAILHRGDDSVVELGRSNAPLRGWAKMAERLDRRLGHHPFTGRRMAEQLRQADGIAKIDLIEMEESFGWSGAVARGARIPVVTRLHCPQFLRPKRDPFVSPSHARHRERAEGRAIRQAAHLSAPSNATLMATRDQYRLPAKSGTVIPNPIAIVPSGQCWRIEDCERNLILFVGRLDQPKGADTMIAAFARVLAECPSARMEMVGPDGGIKQSDGTLVSFVDYARASLEPDVLDRIKFTGLLCAKEVGALRRRANVTVVASVGETFSYTAIEAMAVGSPLISTDWRGSEDIIPAGIAGWRTPVGNAEQMASSINLVLSQPDAAAAMGASARRYCNDKFSIDRVGDQTIDFYQDIVARHPAG
jgi:glycosyltransferase involved in cell wall biosynthesis